MSRPSEQVRDLERDERGEERVDGDQRDGRGLDRKPASSRTCVYRAHRHPQAKERTRRDPCRERPDDETSGHVTERVEPPSQIEEVGERPREDRVRGAEQAPEDEEERRRE